MFLWLREAVSVWKKEVMAWGQEYLQTPIQPEKHSYAQCAGQAGPRASHLHQMPPQLGPLQVYCE